MAKFYQTKEFKELQRAWERKLLASDFIDIENTFDNERMLKTFDAYAFNRGRGRYRNMEDEHEYFRSITNAVFNVKFANELDKTVMAMVGDGCKIKQISFETHIHRQTVRYIIRRYEHNWGLKHWTLKQRNLRHG